MEFTAGCTPVHARLLALQRMFKMETTPFLLTYIYIHHVINPQGQQILLGGQGKFEYRPKGELASRAYPSWRRRYMYPPHTHTFCPVLWRLDNKVPPTTRFTY